MATYRLALTQPQYGNATLEPFGLWRSLVARSVRVGEVAGSNPVSPIQGFPPHRFARPRKWRHQAPDAGPCGFLGSNKPMHDRCTRAECIGLSGGPSTPDSYAYGSMSKQHKPDHAPEHDLWRWRSRSAFAIGGPAVAAGLVLGMNLPGINDTRGCAGHPCVTDRDTALSWGGTSTTAVERWAHPCSGRRSSTRPRSSTEALASGSSGGLYAEAWRAG